MQRIFARALTPEEFYKFGDILECDGSPDMVINQGMCGRYHDRAMIDVGSENGHTGISLFNSQVRTFPYQLEMMERHPLGSQAFLPMTHAPFLVIVAEDDGGKPGTPQAFIVPEDKGVNYHRNTWHGVLTPLSEPGLFAVVDRIGEGNNLEEYWFETPYEIVKES